MVTLDLDFHRGDTTALSDTRHCLVVGTETSLLGQG